MRSRAFRILNTLSHQSERLGEPFLKEVGEGQKEQVRGSVRPGGVETHRIIQVFNGVLVLPSYKQDVAAIEPDVGGTRVQGYGPHTERQRHVETSFGERSNRWRRWQARWRCPAPL
jgi:hypothetical protein